jgi:P pilus assembly chaperone PapD
MASGACGISPILADMNNVDGIPMVVRYLRKLSPLALMAAPLLLAPIMMPAAAHAAGDLLVAPTRVILDSRRGTEVILNNIGPEEATYRISLELMRMNGDGRLDEVAEEAINAKEVAVRQVIRYAPKRVTLPPNQPQSIRIGINPEQLDALLLG